MAQVTGTTDSYQQGGLREDLWDVISNISPMERPFTSNIDRITAKARTHEWLTDSLATASSNKQIEGDDTTFTTAVTVTKLANTCQILKKSFIVSGTLEAVDKAGRKSEVKYQLMKAGNELLRDLEWTLLSPQQATVGGSGTARQMAGAEAWIPSTDNSGNGVRGGNADSSGSTAAVMLEFDVLRFFVSFLRFDFFRFFFGGSFLGFRFSLYRLRFAQNLIDDGIQRIERIDFLNDNVGIGHSQTPSQNPANGTDGITGCLTALPKR